MRVKEVLHDCITWGHAQLLAFASALSPSEREKPGTALAWNGKDHLAHMTYWIASAAERTRKARLGETVAEIDDIDHENERIYHLYRDRSWDEIMTELEAGFQATTAIVDALSEAELTDTAAAPWAGDRPLSVRLVGNTVLHPISHLMVYYKGRPEAVEFARRYEQEAMPMLEKIGDSGLWRGTLIYDAACFWALAGEKVRALELLVKGLELAPNLKAYAKQDGDLDSLRGEPAYQAIYQD
ncbi:MAG: ClbS/DfsB family four-helix bundle protein [Anaerolineae bacterium]|nr:ClbS/DfsB family four-helix bundle protein [Anaerolineae bacterium]